MPSKLHLTRSFLNYRYWCLSFQLQKNELFLLQMLLSSLPELKKSDADFADMAKEIRETFDMYDLDGNGSIDEAELVEGLGEAGGLHESPFLPGGSVTTGLSGSPSTACIPACTSLGGRLLSWVVDLTS